MPSPGDKTGALHRGFGSLASKQFGSDICFCLLYNPALKEPPSLMCLRPPAGYCQFPVFPVSALIHANPHCRFLPHGQNRTSCFLINHMPFRIVTAGRYYSRRLPGRPQPPGRQETSGSLVSQIIRTGFFPPLTPRQVSGGSSDITVPTPAIMAV